MFKNVVISILSALLALRYVPWFEVCSTNQKIGVVIGTMTIIIIFCLFCEDCAEKWQKYRRRVRKMERIIQSLRG